MSTHETNQRQAPIFHRTDEGARGREIAVEQVILDGEIVALDEKGRSSFQLLQVYKSSEQRVPLVYYVFDLLSLEGKDLRKEPLSARRKLLAEVLKKTPQNIRLSEGLQGSKGTDHNATHSRRTKVMADFPSARG